MSLDYNDLSAIRKVVEESVSPIKDETEALRNDIKEIYDMIAGVETNAKPSASFAKLSLEKKIVKLHSELMAAAKQAGITLPNH